MAYLVNFYLLDKKSCTEKSNIQSKKKVSRRLSYRIMSKLLEAVNPEAHFGS